jgi:trehalose 6-phosphate phosphatase
VLDLDEIATRLAPPERAGLILDADGTLAPIAPRPELATVPRPTRAELSRLVGRYRLVAVVSGRVEAEVAALVDVAGVRYVGLYGVADARPISPALVGRVEEVVRPVTGAWVEAKGLSVSVHVRGTVDPDAAEALLAPLLEAVARGAGLELVRGKRTLELAPAGRPRKGGAVERLAREAALEAVLFAGDDRPDLDAFDSLRRLRDAGLRTVAVAVDGPETPPELAAAADLVVEGPEGLALLLAAL